MPSSTHRQMMEMQARLEPLNGFSLKNLKAEDKDSPDVHDTVFGLDMSASENDYVRGLDSASEASFGSSASVRHPVSATSSKDLPTLNEA
jgi:hypothetical protein